MADIDFASLAQEQPYVVAAGLGLIGIVLFLLLGRKSYGPVPSACPLVPECLEYLVHLICILRYFGPGTTVNAICTNVSNSFPLSCAANFAL